MVPCLGSDLRLCLWCAEGLKFTYDMVEHHPFLILLVVGLVELFALLAVFLWGFHYKRALEAVCASPLIPCLSFLMSLRPPSHSFRVSIQKMAYYIIHIYVVRFERPSRLPCHSLLVFVLFVLFVADPQAARRAPGLLKG